jgi:hypothetical protein
MVIHGEDSGNAIGAKVGGVFVGLRIHNAFQRNVAVFTIMWIGGTDPME